MPEQDPSARAPMLPVSRSKAEAKRFYDRISRIYGWLTATSERKHGQKALDLLLVRHGESVLEIGTGSGHCLQRIARLVGPRGRCCGVDISLGMLGVTKERLQRSELSDRVGLCCTDAVSLPFRDNTFDAIFMAFTLELFDTPEIPAVLEEAKRVLKPAGRIAIVSLSKEGEASIPMTLYEWAHRKWPRYADCRPIYVERFIAGCGYVVSNRKRARMTGLPVESVIAQKPETGRHPGDCRLTVQPGSAGLIDGVSSRRQSRQ